MTLAQALSTVRELGLVLRKTGDEYRVNFPFAGEATAYYTNDIADAVDTARAMAAAGRKETADSKVRTCLSSKVFEPGAVAEQLSNAVTSDDSSACCIHGVRLSADCDACRENHKAALARADQLRAESRARAAAATVKCTVTPVTIPLSPYGAITEQPGDFEAQRKAIYDSPCSSYWLKEALTKFDHRDALDMARDVAELNRLAQLRLRELGL